MGYPSKYMVKTMRERRKKNIHINEIMFFPNRIKNNREKSRVHTLGQGYNMT